MIIIITIINSKGRSRNLAERNDRQLPLPPFSDAVAGNPVYMINLLQLDPSKEYLRDSLFFSLFRQGVLLDDLDAASAYRYMPFIYF
jgi:hypothetical protein